MGVVSEMTLLRANACARTEHKTRSACACAAAALRMSPLSYALSTLQAHHIDIKNAPIQQAATFVL
jgi:hypothetical protein